MQLVYNPALALACEKFFPNFPFVPKVQLVTPSILQPALLKGADVLWCIESGAELFASMGGGVVKCANDKLRSMGLAKTGIHFVVSYHLIIWSINILHISYFIFRYSHSYMDVCNVVFFLKKNYQHYVWGTNFNWHELQVPSDWLPSSQFLGWWLGWLGDHGIILTNFVVFFLSFSSGKMRGSQLRKQLIYTVSIHICRMLNGMQNECPIFFSKGGIISEIPHVLWIASLRQRERDQYSDYLRLEMVACWHWLQGWWTDGNHHVLLIWQSNLCSIESSRTVNSQGVGSCCPLQLPLTQTIYTKSRFLERFCWLRPPSLKSYKVLAQTCRRRWRREIVGMKHWFISSRFRWIWNSYENFHQDGKNI